MTIGQGLYGLPEPELPKAPPSRWRWPIRIIIFLTVIGCVGLIMLARMGGNSDSLKDMTEDILTQFTGLEADIGRLNAVSFFPVVGFDFSEVSLSKNEKGIVAQADHINFATGFWATLFKTSELRTLSITGLYLKAGGIVPRDLIVRKAGLGFGENKKPKIEVRGSYGGETLYADLPLESGKTFSGFSKFNFMKKSPFGVRVGSINIETEIEAINSRKAVLALKKIEIEGIKRTTTGKIVIADIMQGLGLDFDISYGTSEISCRCILSLENGVYSLRGDIKIKQGNGGELFGADGLYTMIRQFREAWYGKTELKKKDEAPYALEKFVADLNIHYMGPDNLVLDIPVFLKDEKIAETMLSGEINGLPVSGSYILDASGETAKIDFKIKNANGQEKSVISTGTTLSKHAGTLDAAIRQHIGIR